MKTAFVFVFMFCMHAMGGNGIDFGYTSLTDSYTQNSTGSNTRTLYNLSAYLGLDRSDRFMLGWTVLGANYADNIASVVTTVTTNDNGPTLLWNITKSKVWTLSYTYGMNGKATYTSGATTETWQGTSALIELGYASPLTDTISLGIRLSNYQVSSSKKIVSTTITDISYTRSLLMPMIYFSWRPN